MSRCRNCYIYGHNSRTCPDLTKRFRDRYDYAVETGESQASIDNAAQRLIERTGIDPRTGNKVQRPSSAKRRCSYCKHQYGRHADAGLGHTRRTCAHLKADKKVAYIANAKLRRRAIKAMIDNGIGVGALVTLTKYDYYNAPDGEKVYAQREMPYLVTKIAWDSLTEDNYQPNVLRLTRLDQLGSARAGITGITLPCMKDHEGKELEAGSHKIGDWNIDRSDNARNYQDAWLTERCPPNGLDQMPTDYYNGRSPYTDNHFAEKKR
jgi:hypothetical protein